MRIRLPVLLLLVCGGPAFAQDVVTPSDRVTTFVHVRATADESAPSIGQLQVGQALPLLGSSPRFYQVQLTPPPTMTAGFVSKSWTRVSTALAPRQPDELRIHFLNIGAGSCAVVECPLGGGSNAPPPIIVDCGSTGATANDLDAAAARTYVRNVLSQHSAAPNVVLSHADVDHYSHIANTLDNITVASVWQGGDPADYTSDGFPAWLAKQQSGGAALHRNFPAHFSNNRQPVGNELSCGGADTFVLTVNTGSAKNAKSLVLMIEYEDFTAIFTGDAEGVTETRAITNYDDSVKATVLTSSHHGASTNGSNSQGWAISAAPDILVSSAGSKFGHPRCTAVDRFTSLATTKGHPVRCGTSNTAFANRRTRQAHYVTEVNGAVIVTSNGRSPVTVNCTRSVECGVKIAH